MNKIIPDSEINFMRKLLNLLLLLTLMACQSESSISDPLAEVILETPKGEKILTSIKYSDADQMKGLSGVPDSEYRNDQGMLFFYSEDGEKNFWMPDTYFDLDLFYLDGDLKVTDIVRKLPHYVGRNNPDLIPRARAVWSRHTLEMKATSPIGAGLKIGDQLKWVSKLSLSETGKRLKAKN
jgi:uncharacterized protein